MICCNVGGENEFNFEMGHGLYSFSPCLGGGNGMEWKGMKIIIL